MYRAGTSQSKLYSTNTDNIRKNGTVRLINDSLLLILMWHVSFFVANPVVVITLKNHKITFLIKINSKDDTDSRSAQGPTQRIRL